MRKYKSLYFLVFILLGTFFLAVVYPPSNWDSMTYHLPRIEHWLQNGSLSHYYTHIDRQLLSAPFAEMTILYGRVLSGTDWLMNLVQWFSFLGTLIVISRVAQHLGLNQKMQIVTALFFATVPMAILQASSTQNDLVVTFWLVCALERFIAWYKSRTLRLSLEFGAALGLAILTKGTSYIITLPIVLIFAIICIKQYRKLLIAAVLAGTLCIMINMPHYVRNYKTYQNPIEARASTVSSFTLKSFLVASVGNVYINTPIPIYKPEKINNKLSDMDKDVFPYAPLRIYSIKGWREWLEDIFYFHEDHAKNTFHTLFIILAIILLFWKKHKKRSYVLIVLASWFAFSFCIPWQPWITRLQLPLYAFSAPILALAFNELKGRRAKQSILAFLCIISLLPLLMNYSRPFIALRKSLPILRVRTSDLSIWNTNRDKLVFINKRSSYEEYTRSYDVLLEGNYSKIGLVIELDAWEYPLWRFLRESGKAIPSISHQNVKMIDRDIECLYFLDNLNLKLFNSKVSEEEMSTPWIFHREKTDKFEWEQLYPN